MGTVRMRARKPAPPLENDIRNLCEQWLNLQPGVKVWRQNTGFHVFEHKGKKRAVRYGEPGACDISGVMKPDGRRIEIEVKRPKPWGKEPTEDQREWLQMTLDHGGIAFWCTSLEQCMTFFKEQIRRDLPF